jgi:hypothetical protein
MFYAVAWRGKWPVLDIILFSAAFIFPPRPLAGHQNHGWQHQSLHHCRQCHIKQAVRRLPLWQYQESFAANKMKLVSNSPGRTGGYAAGRAGLG